MVDGGWNTIKTKCTKKRLEGNMRFMESQSLNTKETTYTANRFTPLTTNSTITQNNDEMKLTCENIPPATISDRKRVVKNPKLVVSNTADLQDRLKVNTKVKHNLKIHNETLRYPGAKNEESYPIPTLINRQTSNKGSNFSIK